MRPLAIVFLLIIGEIGTSVAQSFDVMGGVNLATVTGEPGHSILPGYYVGVGKDIPVSKQLSFRPQVYYSRQGAKADNDTQVRFSYIQMPLYFNYAFGKAGILLGPQVGTLLGATYKNERREDYPIISIMNKFDVSIGGGPYYRITENLRVEVRAVFSVTKYNQEQDESLHNRMIQAGVSWTINNSASK